MTKINDVLEELPDETYPDDPLIHYSETNHMTSCGRDIKEEKLSATRNYDDVTCPACLDECGGDKGGRQPDLAPNNFDEDRSSKQYVTRINSSTSNCRECRHLTQVNDNPFCRVRWRRVFRLNDGCSLFQRK